MTGSCFHPALLPDQSLLFQCTERKIYCVSWIINMYCLQILWLLSVYICTYSLLTGERFSPGVGQVNATDEIKREIIHQLSIKPMAHSELVKSLPEDVSTYILKNIWKSFHKPFHKYMETFKPLTVHLVVSRLTSVYLFHNCKNYSASTCITRVTLIRDK